MRWITARTLILLLFFVFVISAVRWVGSANKNPAANIFKLDAEQLVNSCWHNICVGRTTMAQAEAELRADVDSIANIHYEYFEDMHHVPSTILCWTLKGITQGEFCAWQTFLNVTQVDTLYLKINAKDSPITIGDIITLVGRPTESQICINNGAVSNLPSVVSTFTLFDEGRVSVESQSVTEPLAWRLDPTQNVTNVYFHTFQSLGSEVHWNWRGFVIAPGHPQFCAG